MAAYEVNFTNSELEPITIQEETVDTSTDLVLFGRKRLQYGEPMNQNMLSLLEKFACPENPVIPGTPDFSRSGGKLQNPVKGQFWYNSSQKIPFIWNGTKWISLLVQGSIGSTWGIIADGASLVPPVGFALSECVWIVGPFAIDGVISDYTIEVSNTGVVTAKFTPVGSVVEQSLVVNYLIVGIKGNTNNGSLDPNTSPTPTPTLSITPTPTPLPVNLSSGLVSFWEFEEDGADLYFLDCVGVNNWTRLGVAAQSLPAPPPYNNAHGVVGQAVQAGATTYFEANPTILPPNTPSYSFGGWFKINPGFTSYANLFQRGIWGTPGQRSFSLTYNIGTDSLVLYKSNDGSAFEYIQVPDVGLNDLNWHFVTAWVDTVTLTLNIQIDNGDVHSAPFIFPATFNIGTFKLGNSSGIPLQSAVDQLFFYGRVLNSSERSALYNNGTGVSCAFAAGLITPTPSPTRSPTPTPPATPTLTALSVSLSTPIVTGSCSGPNCSATTNAVLGAVTGGVFPYAYEWIYVAGAAATINSTNNAQTTFTRSGTSGTLTGYYRLKVTDTANFSVYSSIVEVVTTHS
jgi:hypothetical protein